ncbi:hypothetical protein [Blastococcus sp. SYSU DS0619]
MTPRPGRPSTADARAALQTLEDDRAVLADRLAAPRWLHPVFALLAAGYVATPAVPSDGARANATGVLIAAGVLLVLAYRRLCGVRVSRIGAPGAAVLGGALVGVLLLLSVSYALVSSVSAWLVLAPAAAGFALVLALGRLFDRLFRENLRRGR